LVDCFFFEEEPLYRSISVRSWALTPLTASNSALVISSLCVTVGGREGGSDCACCNFPHHCFIVLCGCYMVLMACQQQGGDPWCGGGGGSSNNLQPIAVTTLNGG
jgi:hypothetical protein